MTLWLCNLGPTVTLIEIIRSLDSFASDGIICARRPWAENSEAIVVVDLEARHLPLEAEKLRMDYFLEVNIARDFLEDWGASLIPKPTLEERCARLIKYAFTDA